MYQNMHLGWVLQQIFNSQVKNPRISLSKHEAITTTTTCIFYLFLKKIFLGEYSQNICRKDDTACPPCPERLPSCIGVPDGDFPFPGRLWKQEFVTCYMNRTITLQRCTNGYFHPQMKKCIVQVPKGKD